MNGGSRGRVAGSWSGAAIAAKQWSFTGWTGQSAVVHSPPGSASRRRTSGSPRQASIPLSSSIRSWHRTQMVIRADRGSADAEHAAHNRS